MSWCETGQSLGEGFNNAILILSERSSLIPGKWLHHQSSSSSHDASPHPQGERPRYYR
jgi:hypothetical protein